MTSIIESRSGRAHNAKPQQSKEYWCQNPLQLSFRRFGSNNLNPEFPPSRIVSNGFNLDSALDVERLPDTTIKEARRMEGHQSRFRIMEGKLKELKPKRVMNPEEFGGGKLGKSAYSYLIYSEEGCGRITSRDPLKFCGNEPTQTLDFDILGGAEHILVCGEECFVATDIEINRELKSQGRSGTAVGKNGRGRESWTR